MKNKLIIATVITVLATGCASNNNGGVFDSFSKMKSTDPIAVRLVEASEDAAKSIRTLARVNNAKTMKGIGATQMRQDVWQNDNAPEELMARVDVDRWSGPPETIVSNLAGYAGWEFASVGKRPVPTPIVSLAGANKRIIDYLYDIGFQLGDRADLVITPSASRDGKGTIKIKYLTKQNQTNNNWHGK